MLFWSHFAQKVNMYCDVDFPLQNERQAKSKANQMACPVFGSTQTLRRCFETFPFLPAISSTNRGEADNYCMGITHFAQRWTNEGILAFRKMVQRGIGIPPWRRERR